MKRTVKEMLYDMLRDEDDKASRIDLRPNEHGRTGDFAMSRYLNETVHAELPTEVIIEEFPLTSSLSEWNGVQGEPDFDGGRPDATDQSEDSEDLDASSDSGQYVHFIKQHPAYDWLIENLIRETRLSQGGSDNMQKIKREVLSVLPSSRNIIGRNSAPQEFTAIFEVSWDPSLFTKQQGYSEPAHLVLESIITLTGSLVEAQALTTKEYMQQVWPVTGQYMLRLVATSLQALDSCSIGNF